MISCGNKITLFEFSHGGWGLGIIANAVRVVPEI